MDTDAKHAVHNGHVIILRNSLQDTNVTFNVNFAFIANAILQLFCGYSISV